MAAARALFVCDERGSGIPGARALSGSGQCLGVADESGRMANATGDPAFFVKDGFLPLAAGVGEGCNAGRENVVLQRGAALQVVVDDVWGRPIDDALVRVTMRCDPVGVHVLEDRSYFRPQGGDSLLPCEVSARTVAGRVDLVGLGPARYTIDVSLAGYVQCWTSKEGTDIYLPLPFSCTQDRGVVKVAVRMRPVLVAAVAVAAQSETRQGYAAQFLSIGWSGPPGAVGMPVYAREAREAHSAIEAQLVSAGISAGYHVMAIVLTERAPLDLRPLESVSIQVVGGSDHTETVAYAPYPEWTADLCTMVDASSVPEGRRVTVRSPCEPWLVREGDGWAFAPIDSKGGEYRFEVPDAAYKIVPSSGVCRSKETATELVVGAGRTEVVEVRWPIGWIDLSTTGDVSECLFLAITRGSSTARLPFSASRRVPGLPGDYTLKVLNRAMEEVGVQNATVRAGEGAAVTLVVR